MKFLFYILLLAFTLISACNSQSADDQIDWVFVEGGSFEQGKNQFIISPKGDTIVGMTSPNRLVSIDDFYISKYEITVRQFKAFCKATKRKMPKAPVSSAYGKKVYYKWEDHHPMLATWQEAHDFAAWAGGRLATEAEWEYAAKGGNKSKGYIYSGSNNPMEVGWIRENADSIFHAVGLLKPNELGIHDMTGNVSEWVNDWYNPDLDHTVSLDNPKGPDKGEMKIAKGPGWFYVGLDTKGNPLKYSIHMPEIRYQSPIDTRNDGFGFRIVKENHLK